MLVHVIRHSRLPAGNALWVCQNFFYFFLFIFFFFIFIFLFFRRQGFRMITFDRQAGPLQNFNRSHVMVIGRSVLFSDPARPPGGGVGRPKHPKITPPPRKINFCLHAFQNPRNIFEKKSLVGKFVFFLFFCVLRPQEHFLAKKNFQLNIPPPPPTCTPPPSLQNTHPNSRAIINNPNNCSRTYRL